MWFVNTPKPVLSPCVGICVLDVDGQCRGCYRSIDEITNWSTLEANQRTMLMDVELPRRELEKSLREQPATAVSKPWIRGDE